MEIATGIKKEITVTVTDKNTAMTMGSGTLEVFATPAMAALMEKAAGESVETLLEAGCTTVGTRLNISHIRATPLNSQVTAISVLEEIEGRKLTFSVKAYDEKGIIGEGIHERFIVNTEKFLSKL